jgi:DNA polymerase-3 subunit gamma/tau
VSPQGKTKGKGGAKRSKQAAAPKASEAAAPAASEAAAPRAYLVLARRYRPTQFGEVIGQEHVTRTLENAIGASRVHHAYLFTGSRGVGKTTVARIMAKALNCETGPTAHPCDRCPSCVEIREGRAVDVFEIDGASHTGVDDVRALREGVRYMPTSNRHKIYIIDEVHMLSTSAFNALLKTLEEPPPHVVFIFATTEPHKIPATILSRCQRFDFKRVAAPVLVKHLGDLCERERVRVARGGLSLIARASEGSVRDGLSLLDQVIAYHSAGEEAEITAEKVAEVLGVADRRVLFELSRALLGRDARGALQVVDRLFESGHDLSQFARAFLGHLRDLAVVRTCKDPEPLLDVTEAELEELVRQASSDGGELLSQQFDHFARVTEEIARSAFPRLVLEMAAIEMAGAQPLLPLGDLLERLERMEARVARGTGGAGGMPRLPTGGEGGRGRTTGSATTRTQRDAQPVGGPRPAGAGAAPMGGDGEPLERWQRLLEQVLQQEPVAASAFAAGRLVSWVDDKVVLGYPPDSFELGWARDPHKLEAFEQECSRHAGRKLLVQIRELRAEEEASPEVQRASAFQQRAEQQADRARKLREEAEGHPITRMFVETFGATIDNISTEADDK